MMVPHSISREKGLILSLGDLFYDIFQKLIGFQQADFLWRMLAKVIDEIHQAFARFPCAGKVNTMGRIIRKKGA